MPLAFPLPSAALDPPEDTGSGAEVGEETGPRGVLKIPVPQRRRHHHQLLLLLLLLLPLSPASSQVYSESVRIRHRRAPSCGEDPPSSCAGQQAWRSL